MSNRYFDTPRHDALRFVADAPATVLEIGCGAGATLRALRERTPIRRAVGVELHAEAAAAARAHFDVVIEAPVETADIEAHVAPGSVDLLLCLDVLEHLVDPWATMRRLSPLLAPKGIAIVSVPNVRHWKFIGRLALLGDFRYRDAGLLDRTHLRFFTRETAEELATAGGLALAGSHDARAYARFDARALLAAATRGRAADLIAKQWIVVARATPRPGSDAIR